MRHKAMLSTWAIPSRFHGNPVTRVRASSTATHRNGAITSGGRKSRPDPASKHTSKPRSEEHTSELQSLRHLVCRLLLRSEKHTSELQSLRHLVCRLLLRQKEHTC